MTTFQKSAPIWVVFAIGLALRLFGLSARSLWWDEGHHWLIASAPSLSEMFDRWWSNPAATHPPLSHFISFLFLRLGDSEWLLRLPSALAGSFSLPLLYSLARRFLTPASAVAAAAVLAISPFHIWYSQEARMYALLGFAVLLSTVCLLRLSESPTRARGLAYALTIALAGYTHAFGLLVLPMHALWYWAARSKLSNETRRALAWAWLSGALISGPLLLFFAWRSGAPFQGRPFSPAVLPYSLFTFVAGFTLGPTIRELHTDRGIETLLSHAVPIGATLFTGGVALIAGLLHLRRLPRSSVALLLGGLLLPIAAAIAFSLLPGSTYNVRYVISAHPFFCLLGVLGWREIRARSRPLAIGLIALAGLVTAFSLIHLYRDPLTYGRENVREAVAVWRKERGPTEPLFSFRASAPVLYYLPGELWEHHQSLSLEPGRRREQLSAGTEEAAPQPIWLLVARDFDRSVERELEEWFQIAERRAIEGVDLYRLQARE